MNNLDMNQIMQILSKMDPKDIENGLAQAQTILNAKNKETNSQNPPNK